MKTGSLVNLKIATLKYEIATKQLKEHIASLQQDIEVITKVLQGIKQRG